MASVLPLEFKPKVGSYDFKGFFQASLYFPEALNRLGFEPLTPPGPIMVKSAYFKFIFLRGKVCQEKKQTDIFLNNTKVIAPTVKTQAKGQNNMSRALK